MNESFVATLIIYEEGKDDPIEHRGVVADVTEIDVNGNVEIAAGDAMRVFLTFAPSELRKAIKFMEQP